MQLRTRTATGPPAQATRPPSAWGPRIACGLVAVVLLVGGLLLPLWETRLKAPQYPEGLRLTAYGAQVTGDVGEISNLNHYVGMRPFDPTEVPEMQLWPLAMFVAFAAAIVAIVGGRRLWARLARFYVWALPVGVLALIQFRLYQYGHDLDPKAALRIPEFTPKVVGPTKVWNFVTWSYPGLGLLCIALGAALLSFGPRLVDRLRRLILTAGAAVLVTALAAPVVGAQEVDDLAARIARAPEGSTLVVPGGSYHGNLVVDRPLVLQGRDRPLLHGHGTGTVLTITASDVVVRGFRVSGSGRDPTGEPAGIRIEGDRVTIEDTWIDDAYTGIAVVGAAETRLVGNHIRGRESAGVGDDAHVLGHHSSPPGIVRGDGISLWNAAGALVRDNTIDGVRDGVYTSFGSDILVDGNVVRESRYALHTMYSRDLSVAENRFERNLSGAVIMYGGGVLLLANTIRDHRSPSTGFGILLKDVDGTEAARNVVVGNRVGLHVDGPGGSSPSDTRFVANTVASNGIGVSLLPSAAATFTTNSFVHNATQVVGRGRGGGSDTRWSHHGTGNFWSNYQGFDRSGEGLGDLPHHEGSTIPDLVSRTPVLGSLASNPGLRLAAAVRDRWVAVEPLVRDPSPLLRPHSPPLALDPAGGSPLVLGVLGLVLAAFGSLVLIRCARPMHGRLTHARS